MSKTKKREEIEKQYKWDLSKIYKTEDEINKDIEEVKTKTEELVSFKGRLLESSEILKEATDKYFDPMPINVPEIPITI